MRHRLQRKARFAQSADLDQHFAGLLEAAAEGIYGLDAEGRVMFVNPAAEAMTGWSRDEQIGMPLHDLIHHARPDGSARAPEQRPIRASLTDGRPHRGMNEAFKRKDGSSFPAAITSVPVFDYHGAVTGAVVTFSDITLRLDERRFRSLIKATGQWVWRCTPDGKLADVDDGWLEQLRLDRPTAMAQGWLHVLPDGDREEYGARWNKAFRQGAVFECLYRLGEREALPRWFLDRAVPVTTHSGEIAEWVGTSQEITAHKHAELAMRRQREQYRTLVESMSAILWEADPENFRFTFVSHEAESLLGYPAERWIREPDFWVNHIHPEDRDWAPEFCAKATRELRKHSFDYRMIDAGGRTVWLRDVVTVLVEGDRAVKLVGVMVEITALKNTEAALEYVSGLQDVLVELSKRFVSSEPDRLGDLIDEALARVGGYCKVDRSYLFRFKNGHELMDNTHEWCAPGVSSGMDSLQDLPREAVPNVVASMERGEVMHVPRVADLGPDWPLDKEVFEEKDIQSLIVVPVSSKAGLLGCIGFDSVRCERQWNSEEIRLLEGLADVIGATMQRDMAEQALRDSEMLRANAETLAKLGSWEWDIGADCFVGSEGWCRVIGFTRNKLSRDEVLTTVHPDEIDMVKNRLAETVDAGRSYDVEHRIVRRDTGEVRWIRAYAEAVVVDGKVRKLRGFSQDVTERRQAEERARCLAERLTRTVESITDAFYTLDRQWRFRYLNREAERVLGQDRRLLMGKSIWEEFDDLLGTVLEKEYRRAMAENQTADFEFFYPPMDAWFEVHAYPSDEGLAIYFRNVTERKRAAAEIEFLALYDPVTHLPNRRLLTDRLHHALAVSARTGRKGAVLFLDLDNFKSLNDTLGHDMGDRLLQQAAARLRECVRENDTVARFGGDEFTVVLGELSHDAREATANAERVGEKILESLTRPYRLMDHEHYSTVSLGITVFGEQDDTPDEVMKRADLAMYQAKNAGRATLRVFDPDTRAAVNSRVALESELRTALKREEIVPYYQPQVNSDGDVIGAEALARWIHPEYGLVFSSEFIGVAEESGQIIPLGRAMLESVCRQIVAWDSGSDLPRMPVSVNVSARQFHHPAFVEDVNRILQETGADPSRLRLELTESLLLQDMEDTSAKMRALKSRGIGFSLDDFGTGYSSLIYLKNLPLDQLKIDATFTRDLVSDEGAEAIVRTIIVLANSLGLEVIAEGVESEDARRKLEIHGCHTYQGFLFSRAVPVPVLEEYIRARLRETPGND